MAHSEARTCGLTSDPTSLDGALLRIDPDTGAGAPGNPFASSTDANARRIIAYGLRNPFRITFRPGTGELWAGDVGWNEWEEINRVVDVADTTAENFGWPCYEGTPRQPGYDAQNLPICETLYGQNNAVTAPYFAYRHSDHVIPSESCPIGGSSIAGLSFAVGVVPTLRAACRALDVAEDKRYLARGLRDASHEGDLVSARR